MSHRGRFQANSTTLAIHLGVLLAVSGWLKVLLCVLVLAITQDHLTKKARLC
jgi:hypothetical protein